MKRTKEKTLTICLVFLVASVGMVTGDMTKYPTVLISPFADVIPTMDGKIGDGEWDDANSVTITAISNMSQEHGKVYIKNTPYTLYLLMDCYAPP